MRKLFLNAMTLVGEGFLKSNTKKLSDKENEQINYLTIIIKDVESTLWLRGLRTRLVAIRIHMQSLASLRGLRIQHCHKLWYRSQMQLRSGVAMAGVYISSCSSDSSPSLILPYAAGLALKNKGEKKEKIKRIKNSSPGVPTMKAMG